MSGAVTQPQRTRVQLSTDPRANFPTIVAVGRKLSPHEDFYYWILTLTWPRFFAVVAAAFFGVNAMFGALYALSPGSVANARGFVDCFFFSVQTLATIGYGGMAPQTPWAQVIMTFETLSGIISTAVITGLTFARFARPTAKILFAQRIVVGQRNGVPHVMFRMANWRRNQIVEAQFNVMVLLTETTVEGETMRRPHLLKLVRDRNPMFALSWTAMHTVDASSPFYGPDAVAKLREQRAEIFVTVTGIDETLMQTIIARWRYQLDDIVPNARFADILVTREDGTRVIDFDKFHVIETIEEKS